MMISKNIVTEKNRNKGCKLEFQLRIIYKKISKMMKQSVENHLKKKYVASVGPTPMFFTAPHTKKLNRGGKEYGQNVRIHKRQIYTSFLACDFAKGTGKNSFLFWGVSNVISQTDLDPNYLLIKQFSKSPFHQSLHHWASLNPQRPIFHIDIHGKMNRQNNCLIDVGIRPMEVHWEGDSLIGKIIHFFEKEGNIFQGLKFRGYQCKFDTEPYLHGYWGCQVHTMTQQAILLGIPSIQLQIPLEVRKKLFKDPEMRGKFHNLLRSLYQKVIVEDFNQKKRKYKFSNQLAKAFVPTIKSQKQRQETYEQVARFELKEENNPNQNKSI